MLITTLTLKYVTSLLIKISNSGSPAPGMESGWVRRCLINMALYQRVICRICRSGRLSTGQICTGLYRRWDAYVLLFLPSIYWSVRPGALNLFMFNHWGLPSGALFVRLIVDLINRRSLYVNCEWPGRSMEFDLFTCPQPPSLHSLRVRRF